MGMEEVQEQPSLAQEGQQAELVENNPLTELDKLERFKFDGQEWTLDDLRKSVLRQSDYTKKMQEISKERQTYESERKYLNALQVDLPKVLSDPRLVEEFKKVYPSQYHHLVSHLSTSQSSSSQQANPELEHRLRQMEDRFQNYEQSARETVIQAAEAKVDVLFSEMQKKYPLADEAIVISRAQALIDQGTKLADEKGNPDQAAWEKIWKSVQSDLEKRFEGHYKKKFVEQKSANTKAKDSAAGGGIPGSAPKKMSLKEATEHAIQTLTGR